MNRKKQFISNDIKSNKRLKSFIIAFAVFIVFLSAFSIVLFMYSLDFDINNLIETTTEVEETTTEAVETVYTVEDLTGTSNVMFLITDNEGYVKSVFCTLLDFDNKIFQVKQIDGDFQCMYKKKYMTVNGIYSTLSTDGLAEFLKFKWNIDVDKYAVFAMSDLRRFLSSFNGLTVNITENVNYKSADYNLELEQGIQELSGEKALNYLMIADNKEQVICDIITSILTEEHFNKAENLFKSFANASETDISIIDFYDALDSLEIYCMADDKFLPKPFSTGEGQ